MIRGDTRFSAYPLSFFPLPSLFPLSLSLCLCLGLGLFVFLCFYSLRLPVYLSVCLSVCLPVCLSLSLKLALSPPYTLNLPVCPSFSPLLPSSPPLTHFSPFLAQVAEYDAGSKTYLLRNDAPEEGDIREKLPPEDMCALLKLRSAQTHLKALGSYTTHVYNVIYPHSVFQSFCVCSCVFFVGIRVLLFFVLRPGIHKFNNASKITKLDYLKGIHEVSPCAYRTT